MSTLHVGRERGMGVVITTNPDVIRAWGGPQKIPGPRTTIAVVIGRNWVSKVVFFMK
jgi:hypothetical protein